MSITAAFAFGFDPTYCAADCKPTKPSPYFSSRIERPYDSLGIRPTMSLAAASVDEAKRLIERGVASDASNPTGTAYLVSTPDRDRNVRAAGYAATRARLQGAIPVEIVEGRSIEDRQDVMFYFTGLPQVPGITRNR